MIENMVQTVNLSYEQKSIKQQRTKN